ncbi:MAG: 23S rRNA (uracil(1939)-C(5))-methyltransferase RlmD [Thiotrichales bacterium]|nr:23S rRNA (uracil(1939)-C(5))-methyltransferase RlmD [Thiotrichales bacterium]
MARAKKQVITEHTATVEDLSHDGRGVVRIDGKAVFLDGALPGEEATFNLKKRRRRWDVAELLSINNASNDRVEPRCAAAAMCGGCSLQHLSHDSQIALKQRSLLESLKRIGKTEPEEVLPIMTGGLWGYRRKARLGVRYVTKKQSLLVGFREKDGRFLTDMHRCEVLHPSVGERIDALRELVGGLDVAKEIAQIEVAIGDDVTALIFRNLVELADNDKEALIDFAKSTGLHIYLQPAGPKSVAPLWPLDSKLFYRLDEFDLEFEFLPSDFTQVNHSINHQMIAQAMALLDLNKQDRVFDLFCGLGNFSLPIAKYAGEVLAVEGESSLVQRAKDNAQRNGIDNVEFHAADLSQPLTSVPWFKSFVKEGVDKMLLDPPRSGAYEIIKELGSVKFKRIVYVSCHPGSLARDTELLVGEQGYKLVKAGIMDMFPHTAHVEAMAVFER